jgi:hypothetical protein
VFVLLINGIWRRRGEVMALTGPMLYVAFFLTVAYALSAGNAGTSFRYRTHVVTLAVAALCALRWGVVPSGVRAAEPADQRTSPEPGRPLAAVH